MFGFDISTCLRLSEPIFIKRMGSLVYLYHKHGSFVSVTQNIFQIYIKWTGCLVYVNHGHSSFVSVTQNSSQIIYVAIERNLQEKLNVKLISLSPIYSRLPIRQNRCKLNCYL